MILVRIVSCSWALLSRMCDTSVATLSKWKIQDTLIQKWCTPIRFYNIRMISNQKGKTKYQLERDLVNHVSALKSESKLFQQRVVIGHFIHWLFTFQSKLQKKPGHRVIFGF